MSAVTVPFIHRRRPLPYCGEDAVLLPPSTGYGVAELPQRDGDLGLHAACKWYWLLERVTFTPGGTITFAGGSPFYNFSRTFVSPLPVAEGLSFYNAGGSVVATASTADIEEDYAEPARRVCMKQVAGTRWSAMVSNSSQRYDGTGSGPDEAIQNMTWELGVVIEDGRWVLKYSMSARLNGVLHISCPPRVLDGTGLEEVASGVFDFAGFSLPWNANFISVSDPMFWEVSGVGITGSAEFLTQP